MVSPSLAAAMALAVAAGLGGGQGGGTARIQNAPPVARSAPSLRALVEISDLSSLAVSPDGRWVAFRQDAAALSDNQRRLSWWIVDLEAGGPARKLADGGYALWTSAGTVIDESPVWAPDSGAFLFRALIDGEVQVWRARPSGQVDQVTRDDADVETVALSGDGTRLRYQVRASRAQIRREEQRQFDDGVLIDASVDWAQNLFGAVQINGRWASQRLSGHWFSRVGVLGDAPLRTRELPLDGAAPARDIDAPPSTAASPPDDHRTLVTEGPPGLGQAFVVSGPDDDKVTVRDETGHTRSCLAKPCVGSRVSALAWRPGYRALVITLRDRAMGERLVVWDLDQDRVRALGAAQGLLDGGGKAGCAVARRWAVCVRATARLAPRLTRIDLDTGRQLDLATPNTELDLGSDLRVEPLAWTTPEGDAMSGVLLTPATTPTGRLPLFITYYSCEGYLRGGVGDEWPLAALASSGVATACINQAPRRAGETPQSQDATRDSRQALAAVASLITRLDARGLIDQGRVGMGGLSFGSEQTLWIATHSDLLAAASIASGQLEPVYYWMNGAPGRDVGATLKAIWGLGPPDQTPQAWARMSSALNTQHLKAPLLMQLPEQEYRYVPELYARLAATKTPVELYAFAGEPHIKVQPRHRLAVYQRNLDWFRFWLLCEEDPEPAKQAQYARWRTLRERSR